MLGIKGDRAVVLHAKSIGRGEGRKFIKIWVWLTGNCDRYAPSRKGLPGLVRSIEVAPCVMNSTSTHVAIDKENLLWVSPECLTEGMDGELFNPDDAEPVCCKVHDCHEPVCDGSEALCSEHFSESA
jgi:hypothetical protein